MSLMGKTTRNSKMAKRECECPIYCTYCGAKLKRDSVGHLCPTENCQWQHGVPKCYEAEDAE